MRIHENFSRAGRRLFAVGLASAAVALPASTASAEDGGVSPTTGTGNSTGKVQVKDGYAIAPDNAPRRVRQVVDAANQIAKGKGYCWGGGHSSFKDNCYDCSGAVSYALHGGDFVNSPMPSTGYFRWGKRGRGDWITVFTNSGHMFLVVKGARFDTSMTPGAGPGWSEQMRSGKGFRKRHPRGY